MSLSEWASDDARYAMEAGRTMHADVCVGSVCQHLSMWSRHDSASAGGGFNQTWWPATSVSRNELEGEAN